MSRPILLAGLCLAWVVMIVPGSAQAQQQDLPPMTPQKHYNGIVAGEEAYQDNSLRRQAELGRQFDLSSDVYWRWSGASSWYPGVFEAWPMVPGSVFGWPANPVPPRITSMSVNPPNVVVAHPGPTKGPPLAPRAGIEPKTRSPRAADKTGSGGATSGLLPGFVPEPESPSRGPAAAGPRAF